MILNNVLNKTTNNITTMLSSRPQHRVAALIRNQASFRRLSTSLDETVLSMAQGLTSEQQTLLEMSDNFAKNELAPFAGEWDRSHHMPWDKIAKAGQLGFGCMYVREDVGGTGLSRLDTSLVLESLSTGCVTTAAYISIHNMCNWMIDAFGTPEQRQKWCPMLNPMSEYTASYCLTEPQSGSDAASLSTKAVRVGNHYVLNGAKMFISGAGDTNVYVVMCRTGQAGPKGISTLIVEKDMPGVSFGKNEHKMGWNAQVTRAVFFNDVKVPVENLLGDKEGQGFKYAMMGLDGGRVNIASCSLGGAHSAISTTKDYIKERSQFGKSIADFQHTQFKLAEMAIKLHTSRLAVRQAAIAIDNNNLQKTTLCAIAKAYATEECSKICNDALQLHGGYGYLDDYPVNRLVRDLRVHEILEGTNQIMRVLVSRDVLK